MRITGWVWAAAVVGSLASGCSCSEDETSGNASDGGSDAAGKPHPPNDGAKPASPEAAPHDAAVRDSKADSAVFVPEASVPDGASNETGDDGGVAPEASAPDAATRDGSASDGARPEGGSPDASDDGSVVVQIPTTDPVGSSVQEGATDVPRTTWVRLDFASGLDPRAASGVTLDCGQGTPAFDVDVFGSTTFVVNPRAPLEPSASCVVNFRAPNGSSQIHFSVAAAGAAAVVPYDRNDPASFEPFPDDYFLVDDATTRTGHRVDIAVPEVDAQLKTLLDSVITPTRSLDGMSPLAPIVVSLPDVVDPKTVPKTATESTDPFATIGLFDVTPASPEYRHRVPFDALYRDELNFDGSTAHTLVVFPSVPLSPRGRYVFVVTNRALVDPSRPLEPSAFFRTVMAGQAATASELRLAPVLRAALDELSGTSPPIRDDDVALALGISVRSDDDIPEDLSSIRSQVEGAPAPAFTITSGVVDTTPGTDVAAIVQGTWSPPDWSTGAFIERDSSGIPTPVGTATLDFTLALPKSAVSKPAPIIMYQHGQPGNAANEVPGAARRGLAKAGFAVIGFTDVANREIIPNGDIVQLNIQALATLYTDKDLPDYLSLLTHADQLSFLRMLPTLSSVDVLPMGAADGTPDLDTAASLGYLGISQGSVHGIGLMAFAPEVHAAALVVGAGRFGATLVHQDSEQLYQGIAGLFTTLTRGEFYAGIATVQMDFDRQDPQNLARFAYRAPLALGSSSRASILMTEGLGDSFVPFYATRSGASQLGIVQLEPHAVEVPFLSTAVAPLEGNVDASTTAAFFQYVPQGYVGATPTPGCVANGEPEGHYCAQTAAEAVTQRVSFFASHLVGVPIISNPFQ